MAYTSEYAVGVIIIDSVGASDESSGQTVVMDGTVIPVVYGKSNLPLVIIQPDKGNANHVTLTNGNGYTVQIAPGQATVISLNPEKPFTFSLQGDDLDKVYINEVV